MRSRVRKDANRQQLLTRLHLPPCQPRPSHAPFPAATSAVGTLLADRTIFSNGLASGMGDSSYKGGRLADLVSSTVGGRALTFNPKPGAGLQFYFSSGAISASKYAGLAFKMAAGTSFAVNSGVTVGVQVAPGVPKVRRERCAGVLEEWATEGARHCCAASSALDWGAYTRCTCCWL